MERRGFLAGALAAIALLATGCGPQQQAATPKAAVPAAQTVAFGTFSIAIDYTPYIVAKQKGWFDKALAPLGAKATYTRFDALPAINEALASNRLDVIFEAEPPVIIGRAAGIDLRVTNLSCTLPVDVLVSVKSPMRTFGDLKGKTIAVLAGTSSQYGMLVNGRAAGLADKDLGMVDMPPPEAKAAFDAGKVDAWAVWPPWVEQEIVAGKGRTLTGGDASIQSLMSMRGAFMDQNPQMAKAISDVLEQAKVYVQEHPDEAIAIMAKEADLDSQVVKLAWPKHRFNVSLTPEVKADIQKKADFLLDNGLIRTRVNVNTDLVRP